MFNNGFNVKDEYKHYSLEELKKEQKCHTFPYAVAAFNFDHSINLGTAIRTSVLFGAERFYIIGRKRYDKRSTVGAHNYIDIQYLKYENEDDIDNIINKLKLQYNINCIEFFGKHLNSYIKPLIKKSIFVFGSESKGIPLKLLNNSIVYSIEQYGIMRCHNVAVCTGIVLSSISKFYGEYNE